MNRRRAPTRASIADYAESSKRAPVSRKALSSPPVARGSEELVCLLPTELPRARKNERELRKRAPRLDR